MTLLDIVFNLIKNHPGLKQREIIYLSGYSRSQVQHNLYFLEDSKLIKTKDGRRGTKFYYAK